MQFTQYALGPVMAVVVGLPTTGLLYFYAGWSAFVGIASLGVLIPLQVGTALI